MTDERLTVSIPDDDEALLGQCRVDTFRAGGPGGQHQNATESGVRLVHMPTGVRAIARDERSQFRNRSLALKRLRARLEELNRVVKPRKPAKKPSRATKRKRLEAKRKRGDTKRLRKPPQPEE
ncbi:MAG: peptide chain release factor-like protein [Longimicrobiales bacterium]|nr:peptide chain release factor-like protein [Longimicrobiales bacterium]